MALVEAVLTYRPGQFGQEVGSVPVGKSSDPRLLRALRAQLLLEAEREVEFWQGVDPTLAELMAAEAERLARVLDFIVPSGVAGLEVGLAKD